MQSGVLWAPCRDEGAHPRGSRPAAVQGRIAARENSDPSSRDTRHPLDMAAQEGQSGVARLLLQHFGIDGCGGPSGGLSALRLAAQQQHLDNMSLLTAIGVVDSGRALLNAIELGREASVKFLLRQQGQVAAGGSGCANTIDHHDGATPLFCAVSPGRSSPRIARLLIDAVAHARSAVEIKTPAGGSFFKGTPLGFATACLRRRSVQGGAATQKQLNRLVAIPRLLLRVEAVHAVSWWWPRGAASAARAAVSAPGAQQAASAAGTPLATAVLRS